MKFEVKVKANAKIDKVESHGEGHLAVNTKATPEKGKANEAVIALLSEHFGVSRSNIKIIRGFASNHKLIDINF